MPQPVTRKKLKWNGSMNLQDLLVLTPKKKGVIYIIGDCNANVESQETPGITPNLALEYVMKQGKG